MARLTRANFVNSFSLTLSHCPSYFLPPVTLDRYLEECFLAAGFVLGCQLLSVTRLNRGDLCLAVQWSLWAGPTQGHLPRLQEPLSEL